ncbi:glycosyltransferase family 2 protein [Collybiopsis luxurians FD-317 M1]|nr:glycosyltransferase family 2 protein [Collybiopsis luxurians FD-317 M1]
MLYLTADNFPVFVPFGVIGFYRYLWYCIRLSAAFAYRPVPLPENPTYVAEEDVTIIVPTIDAGEEFKEAARSWLVGKPKEILIITEEKMLGPLQDLANAVDPGRIRVLTVPFANKRLQMAHGIKNTTTDIIVFSDDDAIWPPTLLPYVLACFEDQKIGGVGTSQRVQPVGKKWTVWEILAAFRLSIRNIEIACSTHIDGGLPCLSGRTAAYRTIILRDPEFLYGFTHDYWLGKYQLNSGDDKFLTRWMVSHGWSTYVQCCKEAELLSTMKPNWRFLKQVLRWTRNTWRSDMRSLFMERYIWTAHPYVAYTMVDKLFNPFTLLAGPCLVAYLVYKSTIPTESGGYHLPWWNILSSYLVWLLATRTAKLLPHLWYRPQDVIYVPAFIVFGYYFAIMKLYALCTLHETGWGTRTGIGDIAAATAAMDKLDAGGGGGANGVAAHDEKTQNVEAAGGGNGGDTNAARSVSGSGSGSGSSHGREFSRREPRRNEEREYESYPMR